MHWFKLFDVLPKFSIVHQGLHCLLLDGLIHDRLPCSFSHLWSGWFRIELIIHRTRGKPIGIKAKRSFPSAGRFRKKSIWQHIFAYGHQRDAILTKITFRASLLEAQQQEKAERERKEKEAAEAREKQK